MARPRLPAALLLCVGLLLAGTPVRAELTHDQVVNAKLATALLLTSSGTATAFCISEDGLFATCDHAVARADEKKLEIVLDPAGETEKRFPCQIVRRLKEDDLAVLKVKLDRKVPVLPLGEVGQLFETQQVAAFGYPFGKAFAADDKSYPSISVNFGRISSLRRKKNVLDAIQLDAQVNPGNSGGPLLDTEGRVVGIIEAGLVATGINFAVPVSRLSTALEEPVIETEAPRISVEHRFEPGDFKVAVAWLAPKAADPKVTIELQGDGPPRTVEARKEADGKYHAHIAPLPARAQGGQPALSVNLEYPGGKLSGSVADLALTVDGQPRPLSSFALLQRGAEQEAFLAEGKSVGTPPELAALKIDLGGASLSVDARKATRIVIKKQDAVVPDLRWLAVVTTAGGKVYRSGEKPIDFLSSGRAGVTILQGKVELTSKREIPLPAALSDLEAAQGGRTLILHLKEIRKLAIFDVFALKMRGFISLSEDEVVFAGGARHILVWKPIAGELERYGVESLELEQTAKVPEGAVKLLKMGMSAPRQALMLASKKDGRSEQDGLYGFDVLKMAVVATAEQGAQIFWGSRSPNVRASADGYTFGASRPDISPTGFDVIRLRDNVFTLFHDHNTDGVLVPSADGSLMFTSQGGVFTNRAIPLIKASGQWNHGTAFVPSYHPSYFLGLPYGEDEHDKRENTLKNVAIYFNGGTQPLLELTEELQEIRTTGKGTRDLFRTPMTFDKYFHFYPQADLLLTVAATKDKLVARHLDVRQMLDEKKIDYLYVTSIPPMGTVSVPYRYRLEAASNVGGVTFALQAGPPGLTISPAGEVVWNEPKTGDETVVAIVKNSAGKELPHTFHVMIGE